MASLIRGLLGIAVLIVGIVLAIYGVVDIVNMTLVTGIVYLIVGGVLAWLGYSVIGLPTSNSRVA